MQVFRHGIPSTIYCDREYNEGPFKEMNTEKGIEQRPSAAEDHEVNGVIESANGAFRLGVPTDPRDRIAKRKQFSRKEVLVIKIGSRQEEASDSFVVLVR